LPYGRLTPVMEPLIAEIIHGKEVWDLGAGDLDHAKHLLRLGADRVMAVDKEGFSASKFRGTAIHPIHSYFQDVIPPAQGIEVAFVSWPANNRLPGLTDLLRASRVVIYLGNNTGGAACGGLEMFDHLTRRKVVFHLPERRNSLIIYGDPLPEDERRPLLGEELAFVSGMLMSFEAAQETATEVAEIVEVDHLPLETTKPRSRN